MYSTPCLLTSWEEVGGGGGGQLTFSELKENCTFFTLSGRINHSEICKAPPTLLQLIAPTQFARLIIIPAAANWKDFTWAPCLIKIWMCMKFFIVNLWDIGIQHQENPHLASRHERGYCHSQCCGSESVGSVCFWASWIRILVSPSKKGCTLQINEPQLQRSKQQRATHQWLSTLTVSGWSSEHSSCTKSSAAQRLYTSMKTCFF